MAKARRELHSLLKLVDVVLEVIDARIPDTSRHPQLVVAQRPLPRVLLLSKADLADESLTKAWLDYFRRQRIPAVAGDVRAGTWVRRARQLLRQAARGGRGRTVRALVAGLPNVGKSTAINSLSGRAKATTGGTPGVTRALQWLSGGPGLQLLDSPGVLWPEKTSGAPAVHLAATATVPETVYDPVDAAQALLSVLQERFPEALVARYGDELATAGDAALEIVARRRGCLLPGGNPDWERAAGIVLGDFRAGRLGRITLELPPTGSEEGGASESDAASDDTAVEDEVP